MADPVTPSRHPVDLLVKLGEAVARRDGLPEREGPIEILAVGTPGEIDGHEAAARARDVDLRGHLLLPGLVNAHTHLDLTHIGPLEHEPREGFVAWVDRVRELRAGSAESISASVAMGVELSLRAGTVLVGDIAGAPGGRPSLTPFETLAGGPLGGVSFLEFFAIGRRERAGLEGLHEALERAGDAPGGGVRLGLQPHAPNTVSLPAYEEAVRIAAARGLPLSTHLAETWEEREFVGGGAGPQRALLERLGIWEEGVLEHVGLGRTPVEHLEPTLRGTGCVVAHVNDCSDRDLEMLAGSGMHVAYCPRASEYFGAPGRFGAHRYLEMLRAGVNVCLGTDSVVNIDAAAVERAGLGTLDEARLLFRRDGADPALLLRMATVNGARALGAEASRFRLEAGSRPVAICVVRGEIGGGVADAAGAVLSSDSPVRFLLKGK